MTLLAGWATIFAGCRLRHCSRLLSRLSLTRLPSLRAETLLHHSAADTREGGGAPEVAVALVSRSKLLSSPARAPGGVLLTPANSSLTLSLPRSLWRETKNFPENIDQSLIRFAPKPLGRAALGGVRGARGA